MSPSSKNRFRVLIIGCGELGSRHLQAVATIPQVHEIEIVDPNLDALQVSQKRLEEVADRQKTIEFRWFSDLKDAGRGGDLCIVATQAQGRCQLIRQVVEVLGYRSFLIEKVVAQSVGEYETLLNFTQRNKISIWVNCKTRVYPVHQWIKKRLNPAESIIFNSIGGNHGLANNGIHTTDLFVFYDGNHFIESAGSKIDPILHPSKRGSHVFDLSGTLHGFTQRGSHFTLSFAKNHILSDHISIVTKSYRAIVDHFNRWAVENESASVGSWKPIPFEGDLRVSEMTKTFAKDILTQGCCHLPTLEECFPAHQFVLNELLPHFNKLLNRQSDSCPVT